MKRRKPNITAYWIAFSDLLMNLFLIFLVLYGSASDTNQLEKENQQLKQALAELKVNEQQFNTIKEIEAAIQELPEDLFEYDHVYKRYQLKRQIQFEIGSDIIVNLDDVYYLNRVGTEILSLVEKLQDKYKDKDIRYVIIIEGMASKDDYYDNDRLSYQRALSVSKLWKRNGIIFNENICEVQISGSGIGGIGRDTLNEAKNQRILIQILPKIGKLN